MRPNSGNNIPAGYFEANPLSPQSQGLAHWWPMVGVYAPQAVKYAVPAEGGCLATSSVAWTVRSFGAQTWSTSTNSNRLADVRRPVPSNTDPFASAWGFAGAGVNISNKRPFTISTWSQNQGGNSRYAFSLGTGGSMANLNIMYVTSTSVRFGFNSWDTDCTVPDAYGRWVHLALTYDPGGNTIYAYCDGVQVGTRAIDGAGYVGNTTFCLGNFATPFAGSHVWGAIADYRVYYRRLNAAEIWNLYSPASRYQLFGDPLRRRSYPTAAAAAARFAGGDSFVGGW